MMGPVAAQERMTRAPEIAKTTVQDPLIQELILAVVAVQAMTALSMTIAKTTVQEHLIQELRTALETATM